ncbi:MULTISPECIES: dihydrofolate reductase [unclassified Bradyrhizobium]|uniref:dihydrofolate reductase n=1 Tax=unclassified Bradyrhizobium TaxID=2631580 RepID=UPI002342B78C|nr:MULTISPECIES: dihydrofolate reductase [unclassified Bradyrhizobium]GLH83107.1 dihydrofolate reductase [Bradyrhizobium sp. SSBR45R]
MNKLRLEGYVIVSADGMLADSHNVMPAALKFPGDAMFFSDALDSADLIVHGRNSYEDQPNSPKRRRLVVTRAVAALAPDTEKPLSTLWNPAGASFEAACDAAGVNAGRVAIIGGPIVFEMFMDRYDTFFLSFAPHVSLPGGAPCFPGVGPERSPQQVLTAHGLAPANQLMLDPAHDVSVTAWKRAS